MKNTYEDFARRCRGTGYSRHCDVFVSCGKNEVGLLNIDLLPHHLDLLSSTSPLSRIVSLAADGTSSTFLDQIICEGEVEFASQSTLLIL